jgi:hypothetical protein
MRARTVARIRRLFFVHRRRPDDIAAELRLEPIAVRRSLVLTGGAPHQRPTGPYAKEISP